MGGSEKACQKQRSERRESTLLTLARMERNEEQILSLSPKSWHVGLRNHLDFEPTQQENNSFFTLNHQVSGNLFKGNK